MTHTKESSEVAEMEPKVIVSYEQFPDLEGQTIIHIRYIAPSFYENGGWISIHPTTFLIGPDGTRLAMLKAFNIPLAPMKYHFSRAGQVRVFTLIFPKIPQGWKSFMMKEECPGAGGFVIRDIVPNNTGVYSFRMQSQFASR